jgi:hypothetical protein
MAEAAKPNSTLLRWRLLRVWRPTTIRATVGMVHHAGLTMAGTGGFSVAAEGHYDLNLDGPPPLSGQAWLKGAVDRLKGAPDCPRMVSAAARRIAPEMAEAFRRRQCDEKWVAKAIENNLITWGWWQRTRPRKG